VQELVGSVRIRVRTEHTGDQKLGLGETLAQHCHKGNRTAEAEITGLLTKELLGTRVRHLSQPRCQWRGGSPIRGTSPPRQSHCTSRKLALRTAAPSR